MSRQWIWPLKFFWCGGKWPSNFRLYYHTSHSSKKSLFLSIIATHLLRAKSSSFYYVSHLAMPEALFPQILYLRYPVHEHKWQWVAWVEIGLHDVMCSFAHEVDSIIYYTHHAMQGMHCVIGRYEHPTKTKLGWNLWWSSNFFEVFSLF